MTFLGGDCNIFCLFLVMVLSDGTEWSPIWSLNCAVIRFVNQDYDYRPNWYLLDYW